MASEEEKQPKTGKIKNELLKTQTLLHKDEVIWPYQKLSLTDFTRKYFPSLTEKEARKFSKLKPEKFMVAIESKLKATDAFLRPLEERRQALEFQRNLFIFFSIFAPKSLPRCQKILKKTPKGIREEFFTEEILEMGAESEFSQKKISELMALWLNYRYYGAMSMGLCPKFLSPFLNSPERLDEKKGSITQAREQILPEIETQSATYDQWVQIKAKLDEERKLMTFGPESVKTMIDSLQLTYNLSLQGEVSKSESLEIVKIVKDILEEVALLGKKEKKRLLSEEKRKEIDELTVKIEEKPALFFKIAQIASSLRKGKTLSKTQNETLRKIIQVVKLLPKDTKEALEHEEISSTFGIIFEPLESLLDISEVKVEESKKKPSVKKKKKKKKKKTSKTKKPSKKQGLELLRDALDKISSWILTRVIEEKKTGLENVLDIFNGIPLILGKNIVKLILNKKVQIDIEKFKECIIEYLSKNGIYEIYSEISGEKAGKAAEIEVAEEIIIPPQPDQRLAPILKQIKFEFMKFLETSKINKQPLFDKLEINHVIPNNLVETLLGTTQDNLMTIITANSSNKLHEIIDVDNKEYEVRLKTISVQLKPLMKNFDDALLDIIKKQEAKKKLKQKPLLSDFKKKIERIWIDSLIAKKKIEPEEKEISTSAVSEIAAKLMAKKPGGLKGPPTGPPLGPPKGPPKGPPSSPPIGPPKGPPSGPMKGPPKGPPKGSPTGPPKGPLASPLKGPPLTIPPNVPPKPVSTDLPETMIASIKEFPSLMNNLPKKIQLELDEEEKKRFETMRNAIIDVEELVDGYVEKPEKFSPGEIKGAFQLLAKVHKLNIKKVTAQEIREVITLAEKLKNKRDTIAVQKQHLKDLEEHLSKASLRALESKIDLIVRIFDDYIKEIDSFIEYLGEKTSFILQEYQKKAGQAYWRRVRIKKARIVLKDNVQFLIKIGRLSDEHVKNASQFYSKLRESRRLKKKKLTGEMAEKLGAVVGIEKKRILKLTKDKQLKLALEEIFKIRVKN